METIYHYTGLETLALILENKTIRFSNLCRLDDPLEKYVSIKKTTEDNHRLHDERENMGAFCFVSCWTHNEDESIPMWDMYADRKQGVRIEMPVDMFDLKFNINFREKSTQPLFTTERKNTMPEFFDIDYDRIDDPALITEDWRVEIGNLGKYKIKDWAFQNECRFRVFGFRHKEEEKAFYYTASDVRKTGTVNLEYPAKEKAVYFRLNDDAISMMRIIAGPEMSDGKRVLLKSLMEKYNISEDRVRDSKFTDRRES